jgi:hypothetical protein
LPRNTHYSRYDIQGFHSDEDKASFQLMMSSSAATVTTSGADDITLMDFKLLGIRVKQLSRISGHGSVPHCPPAVSLYLYNNG